ncbi:DUF3500 domain-containing protein [Mycobacterium sp. URHB0021]
MCGPTCDVLSSSPFFLGADPAESPLLGGHLLRPLGAAEDLARELVPSLDEEQTALALLSAAAPIDIVGLVVLEYGIRCLCASVTPKSAVSSW